MILELNRMGSGKDSTIGALFLNGEHFGFVVEDELRIEKVAGETRIPAGTYDIDLRREGGMLTRYKKMFRDMDHPGMIELQNVPNFKYIYIHIGNFESNSEGCLLVNDSATVDRKNGGGYGGGSRNCYKALYPLILEELSEGNSVQIIINDHIRG